jgi:hypothetical protein
MNPGHAFRREFPSDRGPKLRRCGEALITREPELYLDIGYVADFFTEMANFGDRSIGLWPRGAEP